MKNWFLPLLLASTLSAGCASDTAFAQPGPGPNTDAAQLRTVVENQSRAAGTQAVEAGMWVDGREILTMALGKSMETVPARTDMHFRVGGITETFLATLTLKLAEEGRLNLEDKLSRWYPDLLNADQVTLNMLLANTAGYLDYARQESFIDVASKEPFRQFSTMELVDFAVRDGKMKYPPGTSQGYSHTEYLLLGDVIPKITGRSMAELYQQYILQPAGLSDTEYPADQEIRPPVLHAWSTDRGVFEDATYFNPSWAGAYGGLTSNLRDLGRWGPIFGRGTLLSPASFQKLIAPDSVGKAGNRADLYFARGFVYSNGWYVQNPDLNGYAGAFGYNPSNGVTLVVIATRSPNTTAPQPAFHILRAMVQQVTPDQPLNF